MPFLLSESFLFAINFAHSLVSVGCNVKALVLDLALNDDHVTH